MHTLKAQVLSGGCMRKSARKVASCLGHSSLKLSDWTAACDSRADVAIPCQVPRTAYMSRGLSVDGLAGRLRSSRLGTASWALFSTPQAPVADRSWRVRSSAGSSLGGQRLPFEGLRRLCKVLDLHFCKVAVTRCTNLSLSQAMARCYDLLRIAPVSFN